MKKNAILKIRKWLKARRRENTIRKQRNYVPKTKKGASLEDIRDNADRKAERKKKEDMVK